MSLKPYYEHAGITIYAGDSRKVLKAMPDESVHCVVTSPPYWGLRDYGVKGQLGLETTPYEYIEKMVLIFREVRRVLRSDGTLWLNMGDCYATGAGAVGQCPGGGERGARWKGEISRYRDEKRRPHGQPGTNGRGELQGYRGTRQDGKHKYLAVAMGPLTQPNRMPIEGLKPKDLVGMPWRLALELQADGWYLRQDIIWSKPNPMPESVTDRCTKAHEYIFLLSKSERYYYDQNLIREPLAEASVMRLSQDSDAEGFGLTRGTSNPSCVHPNGANKRSVWEVTTQPFSEAHFATFPEELIKPCILAGCPIGGIILDPFLGSGTTALVARTNGCKCIGIELNPDYISIAAKRLSQDILQFSEARS